jgi:hypothetical protein
MTDTTEARERWNSVLQALNTRKPDAEGATPLQFLAALRREDTSAEGALPYICVVNDGNLDAFTTIAKAIGIEVGRRRVLAAYVEQLLDVAGAASDEAQRRYDQADDESLLQYESGFAEGAQFVLDALRHAMETDPSGARPVDGRIATTAATREPRSA